MIEKVQCLNALARLRPITLSMLLPLAMAAIFVPLGAAQSQQTYTNSLVAALDGCLKLVETGKIDALEGWRGDGLPKTCEKGLDCGERLIQTKIMPKNGDAVVNLMILYDYEDTTAHVICEVERDQSEFSNSDFYELVLWINSPEVRSRFLEKAERPHYENYTELYHAGCGYDGRKFLFVVGYGQYQPAFFSVNYPVDLPSDCGEGRR